MLSAIVSYIKGTCRLKASGKFPERILNMASTSGIYIHNVKKTDGETITFSVSKKGSAVLLSKVREMEGIDLFETDSYGLAGFLKHRRKRVLLLSLPVIVGGAVYAYSQFIWKIEIEGGNKALQSHVLREIEEHGIYVGAPKSNIDNYEIKRKTILAIDDLSWLWVDVRGATAKVKIRPRKPKPDMIKINEPSDVIATHSGIIEKMQVYCGQPLFTEGMSVKEGDILISGTFRSENENIPTYHHHAVGNVILRLIEEKKVIIPKKTYKKELTGREKNVFFVNFKKNNIKFSLNSRISYSNYDRIEKRYSLWKFPLSFAKVSYREVILTETETDITAQLAMRREAFEKELLGKNMQICNITEEATDNTDSISVIFRAECLVRTDKEIPVKVPDKEGEADGKNH